MSWTYDGFGNRLSQNVTKGTGPVVSLSISAATNRITTAGFAYDAAGHMTQWPGGTVTLGADYDVEGRFSVVKQDGVSMWRYLYDARNRRVRKSSMSGSMPDYEVYGPGGELLGVYGWFWPLGAPSPVFRVEEERIYFAGRVAARLDETGSPNFGRMDRLGSVKAWQRYPFGEGVGGWNDEYATYPVDRWTGHYYAWNRFYSATWGRFSSPDPYVMSGGLTNPQGWNRYSYVGNDPVNYNDPTGLLWNLCSAEYSYEQCGGGDLFWGGPLAGGGFGGGYAEAQQQGYVPGMPDAMWNALQQFNAGTNAAFLAAQVNALLAQGNWNEAVSIVDANSSLLTLVEFSLEIPAGAGYQEAVEAYLKSTWRVYQGNGQWQEYSIMDLIVPGSLRWEEHGYSFQFLNADKASELLSSNPMFAAGFLGLMHVQQVGQLIGDFRSWTGPGTPYSLQIVVGKIGGWADIDRFNPYSAVGFVQHAMLEVLPFWKKPWPWP